MDYDTDDIQYQVGEKKKKVSVTLEGSPLLLTLKDIKISSQDTSSSEEADPDSVEDINSPGSTDNSSDENGLPSQGTSLTPVHRGVEHLKKTLV